MTAFLYTVVAIKYLTQTHLQLFIRPNALPMPYEAGQYLTILYPNGNFMPFSIANAPTLDKSIELHIRSLPDDLATQAFIAAIKASKTLTVHGPFGDCQYQGRTGPLLLLAAGTGFAPAKAIIEKLVHSDRNKECHLYWTVKRPTDFYLPQLTRFWQENLLNFHYIPFCTQPESNSQGQKERSILDLISKDFESFAEFQVYAFGPTSLALDTLKRLSPKGLNIERFFTDVLSREALLEGR